MAGLLSIGLNEFTVYGIICYVIAFGVFILGGWLAAMTGGKFTPIGAFLLKLGNIIAIPLLIIGTVLLFGVNILMNIFNNTTYLIVTIGIILVVLIGVMLFILPKKQKLGGL